GTGAAQGSPRRPAARRAGVRPAARLRRHRGVAGPLRGRAAPAHRHRLPGSAPAGGGRAHPGGLVHGRGTATAHLRAHRGGSPGAAGRAGGVAAVLRHDRQRARRPPYPAAGRRERLGV
ncbi:MAG: Transcriptional regulator, PadR family, partial [uncultured Friedmanniella sp.]